MHFFFVLVSPNDSFLSQLLRSAFLVELTSTYIRHLRGQMSNNFFGLSTRIPARRGGNAVIDALVALGVNEDAGRGAYPEFVVDCGYGRCLQGIGR